MVAVCSDTTIHRRYLNATGRRLIKILTLESIVITGDRHIGGSAMQLSKDEHRNPNSADDTLAGNPNRHNEKDPEEVGQVGCAVKSSRLVSTVRRTMFNTENRDTRR